MRITCISDTHGKHNDLKSIPDGDVLICAGDITSCGQLSQLEDFSEWISDLPHRHKIAICGNHDWCFQKLNKRERALSIINRTAIYLEDSYTIIDGIKFYGSPWQPEFRSWAFNLPRGKPLAQKWEMIDDDCDVLITHGPPYGYGDRLPDGMLVGCEDLGARIRSLKSLKLSVFGHIHDAYGEYVSDDGVRYINASNATEEYDIQNCPITIDIL